ncbi:hypothetical protein [Candidatus Sodalis endolongispinus]
MFYLSGLLLRVIGFG